MSPARPNGQSNWIPARRIRFAVGLALVLALAGVAGAVLAPFPWGLSALILLLPALGAGVAAFVMMGIRAQLSPGGGGWEKRIHELVVSRLALAPGAQTLDIGCGDASLLVALLKQAPDAVATGVDYWGASWDYAQAACEARLKKAGLRAAFRRMDAAKLEFPDASFDAVVSVMCFHEVRAPAGSAMRGSLLAVSEALRVLKPGGQFVLIDRFGDASDYGEPQDLSAVLKIASGLRREKLVAAMGVPWPLSSKRALGPVEMLTGRKPG